MPLGIALLLIWLILLVRFPRVMLPASGIVIVIALLLAAAVGVWQWRHERQVNRLEITVRYLPEACEFGKPIQVSIHNASAHTTRQISWQLSATQPNYNTNLLDVGITAGTYHMNQPLQVDEQWLQCYSAPPLRSGYRAADVQYHASRVSAEFQR